MKENISRFIRTHRADDIFYATRNPEYFGLSTEDQLDLCTWMFALIDKATESLSD